MEKAMTDGNPIAVLAQSEPTPEECLWALERLVLEMTKHIPAAQALPPGAIVLIEELKRRHPDV